MAEYIDKKHLDRKFQIDMMALRGGTIFDTRKIIDSLPPADVVEHSEYEKLRLVNLDLAETNKGLLAEHEQLLELRSKINKAIEEMNSMPLGLVMDCDEMRDYCVEILKRNIGE